MMKRLSIALSLLLAALVSAAIQERTLIQRLDPGHAVDLSGARFRGLVTATELERAGTDWIDLGTLDPNSYAIDSDVGTITRNADLDGTWARLTWQWDDAPAQAEADVATAEGQLAAGRPSLAAGLAQALQDIDAELSRAAQIQTQMSAQLAAFASDPNLPASPTTAQLRTAFVTLSTRYQESVVALRDAAIGSQRNLTRTRQAIKLLSNMLGIPLPSGVQPDAPVQR